MSNVFKPHRGNANIMANQKKNIVLEAGEMFIELPDEGEGKGSCKMKIGDGITTYSNLPYAMGDNSNFNIDTILDRVYPIGSIYMSLTNTDPSTLFGGTWEQLQDRFLVGAGGSYAVNSTGGANSVTLNVNQIPSHSHAMTGLTSGGTKFNIQNGAGVSPNMGGGLYTGNTGGGQAHENRPPYLAVYMWKRTA